MNGRIQSTLLIIASLLILILGLILGLPFVISFILSILIFVIVCYLFKSYTKTAFFKILKSNIVSFVFVFFAGLLINSAIIISIADESTPIEKIHYLVLFFCAMILIVSFAFINTQNIVLQGDKKGTKTIKSIDLNDYLLALSPFIANSEFKGIELKIDYFEKYFRSKKIEIDFKIIIKKIIDYHNTKVEIDNVCNKILWLLSYKQKCHLIFHLIELAVFEKKKFEPKDESILRNIAQNIGINSKTFNHFKGMFIAEEQDYSEFFNFSQSVEIEKEKLHQAYLILDIQENASEDEIKKAYRGKVKEFHPDKVNYLGIDAVNDAEATFKKLQEAYFIINQSRK